MSCAESRFSNRKGNLSSPINDVKTVLVIYVIVDTHDFGEQGKITRLTTRSDCCPKLATSFNQFPRSKSGSNMLANDGFGKPQRYLPGLGGHRREIPSTLVPTVEAASSNRTIANQEVCATAENTNTPPYEAISWHSNVLNRQRVSIPNANLLTRK